MNKEKLKTILIGALFLISLLLTQQLWIVFPFGDTITTSRDSKTEDVNFDVADILSPQSFVINFGGGNHTVYFAEPYEIWNITKSEEKEKIWIWKNVRESLRNFFSGNIQIEVIDEEQWKNINKFKSLRLDFASFIPSDSLVQVLSSGNKSIDKNIEDVNSLLIPAIDNEKNNIYLANLETDFYLKIIGTNHNDNIRILVSAILEKGEDKGYISYYPIRDYIPVDNSLLTPIFEEIDIPEIKTINEVDVTDKTLVRSLANKFFGERMDFVKEIRETNGTIIYMYGYGEKALKINSDGLLEHIEQPKREKISNNLDFIESLKTAGKFVKEYIGWPINSENAYLSNYEIINKENLKGYRFSFNYRLNGLPVIIPNIGQRGAIEVEVLGNQVTYYRRIIKKIEEEKPVNKEAPFIISILDKNFEILKDDYIKNSGEEKEVENTIILENLNKIELAYFYDKDKEILIPSWKIVLKDMTYYFDLYDGNLIYSYKN